MTAWSEDLPGKVRQRVGTPSAVAAIAIRTCRRLTRWFFGILENWRHAHGTSKC